MSFGDDTLYPDAIAKEKSISEYHKDIDFLRNRVNELEEQGQVKEDILSQLETENTNNLAKIEYHKGRTAHVVTDRDRLKKQLAQVLEAINTLGHALRGILTTPATQGPKPTVEGLSKATRDERQDSRIAQESRPEEGASEGFCA